MNDSEYSKSSRAFIKISALKPRHKALNDALVSLGGGKFRNPKDRNRQREKLELKKVLLEEEQNDGL